MRRRLCPGEREAGCGSQLRHAHEQPHAEALVKATSQECRVEASRFEGPAFIASAAKPVRALAVPELLTEEPAGREVLMMDDTSVLRQPKDVTSCVQPRAPFAIFARRSGIRLIELDRLEHRPLAGKVVRGRELQAPVSRRIGWRVSDELGRLGEGASAAERRAGCGVCTSVERLRESLGPFFIRYAVVVGEAKRCAACVLRAGIPCRRRASAGASNQSCMTIEVDGFAYIPRGD